MIPVASFAEIVNGVLVREYPNNIEVRLPSMGLTNKEAEGIKNEQKKFKLEQSYAPNIVGIDQSGILRGIRSNDPKIKLRSEKLYTQLSCLQHDIAELTQAINQQAIIPLKQALTSQHAICRRLLDKVEAFPAKLGAAQNLQREANRDFHTVSMKLTNATNNPPNPAKFPTDREIDAWHQRCATAQSALDAAGDRVAGFNEKVTALESEALQLTQEFTEASKLYVSIQQQIEFLSGKPAEKKTSVQRSEFGLR
jgi:chromosome segregation ATPase